MPLKVRSRLAFSALLLSACAGPAVSPATGPAPAAAPPGVELAAAIPIDSVRGPLALRVQYPAEGAVIDAADSSFFFGTTGAGDAALTINGAAVRVAANGAWLAWLPLPPDSVMRFELVARTPRDSQQLTLLARRPARFVPPPSGPWIDSTSFAPAGDVVWPQDEFLPVSLRAHPEASVRIRLADSTVIPLVRDGRLEEPPWGIRAFDRNPDNLRRGPASGRFAGLLRGRTVTDSAAVIEAILGTDTASSRLPLRLTLLDTVPALVELDDDPARRGGTDGITVGRAVRGGTYQWFWPAGTVAPAAGRMNGDARIRLAPGLHAWVAAGETRASEMVAGAPPMVGSLTLGPTGHDARLRVPLSARVPFEIVERERELELTLFGTVGDVNWIRHGGADSVVRNVAWSQTPLGVRLTIELAEPVWGFRSRWDRGDLLLDIRRPPLIDASRPLAGRLIVVDPGHPPLGASGPTGYTEAEANLAVSLVLRDLLEDAGARVIMTRTDATPVDLGARPRLADSVNADLLVSVHNNALPDGVNPFPNNGTSVFYNHPRSIPLALAVQQSLVRQLGLRDLGIGRGDLALVRPTWMPAILTEGLFLMVPEQEAALRSAEGRRRYARGIFDGIRVFLQGRATRD